MPDDTPRAQKTKKRRRILWTLGLVLVFGGFLGWRLSVLSFPVTKLEVGRETTFVEGPQRPDGTIDYGAALNAHMSQGVTTENNAVVLLAQAIGPSIISPEMRTEFFRELGIPVPPENGEYLISLEDYLTRMGVDEARQNEFWAADNGQIPFSAEEFPELVEWIEASEEPIRLIVEATRRERFYLPTISTQEAPLLTSRMLPATLCRELSRTLKRRALLRLESDDLQGACEDAVASHRLARLITQNIDLMSAFVGYALDHTATEISQQIVLSGKLTSLQARQFRGEIASLPTFSSIRQAIDIGERMGVLEHLIELSRGRNWFLVNISQVPKGFFGGNVNVVLRDFNVAFDRIVAAMSIPDIQDRQQATKELAREFKGPEDNPLSWSQLARMFLIEGRAGVSRMQGRFLLAASLPSVDQTQSAEDRSLVRAELTRIGWTLADYRAHEGEFPENLNDLVPDYLDSIPLDPFTRAPLRYGRSTEGFLLYSVGPNGIDDGGERFQDADDIAFGVPQPSE